MKWNKLFAKLKKPLIIAGCTLAVAFVAGFFLNCLFTYNFKFRVNINLLVDGKTYLYAFLLSVIALTVVLAYYYKVYDEKVADIIKSNCNIQMFIGTSDYKTVRLIKAALMKSP